ncbi:nucleotidyltransferase domain-containing protein [Virgibacillus ainsalahensis]
MTADKVIDKINDKIQEVTGVTGVVLGGSRARGTYTHDSDIDIGIYYDTSQGFDPKRLNPLAYELNDDKEQRNLITELGEWGDWINAGGWLVIDGYHVDLILRDIHRVEKVIEDCHKGLISMHYQTGHPHGFSNAMYMGELAISKVISAFDTNFEHLKERSEQYPPKMKEAIIQFFSFEASFSLMFMEANINKDDLSYMMGHGYRAIACLNQVLFAKNEAYCINEKKAVKMATTFPIKPTNYKERIDEIITLISTNKKQNEEAIEKLKFLIKEIENLEQKRKRLGHPRQA